MIKIMKRKSTGVFVVAEYRDSNWVMSEDFQTIEEARAQLKKQKINRNRRERHEALTDLGLKRVRGALGGVYYE